MSGFPPTRQREYQFGGEILGCINNLTGTYQASHFFEMSDKHHMMILHWAGEGSDVIMALTRDVIQSSNSSSQLFVSNDYGHIFVKKQDKLMKLADGHTHSILNMFYHSPVYNSHYVFTDTVHNCTFTTRNYGRTFNRHSVPFAPEMILMHPRDVRVMVGQDTNDPLRQLYVSKDFGVSWTVMERNVKSFSWGDDDYDGRNALYIERRESSNSSTVLMSTDYFTHDSVVINNVEDFQLLGAYMLASKTMRHSSGNKTLQLWVSHQRKAFQLAQFDEDAIHKDYYVADASEDQVFLCVNHNTSTTHLYISAVAGIHFTLSLTNIVYFNPKAAFSPIPSHFARRPFADIHKVQGLRGIYIASQMKKNQTSHFQQVSVITFNKGARWQDLAPPIRDSNGNYTHCLRYSWFRHYSRHCSLHLMQNFHQHWTRSIPILTKKSAVGLILGTGSLGATISPLSLNVYISRDAGFVWHEVLKGPHFYAFGDHGGLIVAVRQKVPTGELMYSYNEGETWTTYIFSLTKMTVYGVLTEPGEHTTVFTIFGSPLSNHSWVVVYVNLKSIFRNIQCVADDYKDWSPADNARGDCLMGRKIVYQRRIGHVLCYNGRSYIRPVSTRNCLCKVEDYECDFGFHKRSVASDICERQNKSVNVYRIPAFCPQGSYYNRTKGYRRVAGDTCQGGDSYRYDPVRITCPIAEAREFLLYINGFTIHRYLFGTSHDELLPLADVRDAVSVEYDYQHNCIYWGESTVGIIR
ncbi:Sortilin-related receptor, partial [Lamellibrachia satsuma]